MWSFLFYFGGIFKESGFSSTDLSHIQCYGGDLSYDPNGIPMVLFCSLGLKLLYFWLGDRTSVCPPYFFSRRELLTQNSQLTSNNSGNSGNSEKSGKREKWGKRNKRKLGEIRSVEEVRGNVGKCEERRYQMRKKLGKGAEAKVEVWVVGSGGRGERENQGIVGEGTYGSGRFERLN